ncbi:MAG: hypothetical protein JWM99_162 [Verrucomicrobiales bacterium]|jgi:hypothetical protein|nr:hypothetical protein [Verrucomicrobiales bacterium]
MSDEKTAQVPEIPFVNEMRLNTKQWLITSAVLLVILVGTPFAWKHTERFKTDADYRIPYSLSKDYWLYHRRLQQIDDHSRVLVLGDSVVWGEYVLPDGTLSHFLNAEAGQTDRFVNAGVNGLFPLALDGLVNYYGGPLRHRRILVNCNLLWMSNPKADLQTEKEEKFNHSHLVPQFSPRIPCYRADANERLSAVAERNFSFLAWVNHLQSAYFNDKSIPIWTLQDDGNDPPHYTNSYRNPLTEIKMAVPEAPANDPQRGPASPRHRSWTENGGNPAQFEWVTLASSLQWQGFQHLIATLNSRSDDVLVLLGPFNEHMIAKESRPGYQALREGITSWLTANKVQFVAPPPLPTELYADASHPLTAGYHLLAKQLSTNAVIASWIALK